MNKIPAFILIIAFLCIVGMQFAFFAKAYIAGKVFLTVAVCLWGLALLAIDVIPMSKYQGNAKIN